MIRYSIECIAFQLVFMVIYDLLLKRETFFQWNRLYLIGTYGLSLLLPWIKIEALKKKLPQQFNGYADYLWNLQGPEQEIVLTDISYVPWSWQEGLLYGGMLVATLVLFYKLGQLYRLRRRGTMIKHADFNQIIIKNSSVAFSFFKSVFIGDKVLRRKHDTIIAHELVHIKQGHTWDLLFFELMRIIGWFNPLVYVYQNRTVELHEFIADAQVTKAGITEYYQQLLTQVFQTGHGSFINQFFTRSLIKKRIVMLQKAKSKKVLQLKYVLLVPMVMGMLVYTSCEMESKTEGEDLVPNGTELKTNTTVSFAVVDEVPVFPGCENVEDKKACFNEKIQEHISKNFNYPKEAQKMGIEGRVSVMFWINNDGSIKDITMRGPDKLLEEEVGRIIQKLPKMKPGKQDGEAVNVPFSIPIIFKLNTDASSAIPTTKNASEKMDVPFSAVDEVPLFPGCENADDQSACFNEKIQLHISKNFSYPIQAQEAGIQGRVSVIFRISSEGIIENIKTRGPDASLEHEVVRIIERLPVLTPGKNNGVAVNVVYSIPVNFKLQ